MKATFNLTRFFLFAFFILLATVAPFVTIDGKNYLLISFSVLGMIVLLITSYDNFPRWREPALLAILAFLIFSFVYYIDDALILSFVYSLYFIVSFLFYSSFMREKFTPEDYARILKITFIIYFFGLVAGQLILKTVGFLPITKAGTSVHGIMGVVLEPTGYRFYSFSSEPSYASFIVIVLYYSFSRLDVKGHTFFRNENTVFFCMLVYMILMFKSAYGVLLLGALIVAQFGFSRRAIMVYSLGPLLILFVLVSGYEFASLDRVIKIITELDLTNLHTLAQIDFTSYYRLAPFLHFFETASLINTEFYIGHGAGASKLFIVPEIYLAYPNGEFAGGFLPSFLFDYGIIGALLVFVFIYQRINFISIPTLIIFLLLLNANFSTQLFWLVALCLTLNHHFRRISHEPVR